MSDLLEIRNQMKRKKPIFARQEVHKKKRVDWTWKKPRGLHNKIRLRKSGHRRPVSVGYRSPVAVRGLSRQGLKIKLAYNKKDVESADKEKEGVVIGASVGLKKKLMLLNIAREKQITVINVKDVDAYIKLHEENIKKKTEDKKKKEKVKKEEKAKKKEEKLEEKISEEEKKEQEKKEKDKLLTKREI